jgi:SOS response regulatory protein OraA/RecX
MKTRIKDEYALALDRMTRYLALRDHSRHELQQKLRRAFSDEIVTRVLEEAEGHGWLAAEEVIAERAARALGTKCKSRRYIEGALRKRRLPVPPRDDKAELEKIRALLQRKFGSATELSLDDKAKAVRFLKYRGFEDRSIRQVLNEKP